MNKKFNWVIPKPHFLKLLKHEISAKVKADQSFADEVGTINDILKKINSTQGYIVDIAASDGLTMSSTYHLFKTGRPGLCIEYDAIKFSKLAFLYRNFLSVCLLKVKVTPKNVIDLLRGAECPRNFEFLNLDIDSYDLHVMRKILEGSFRPKLISMEINEKIPSKIYFTVDFEDDHYWGGDHFYGCSLSAAESLMSEFNYSLVELQWNNACFMPNDLIHDHGLDAICPNDAYDKKYRQRTDRLEVMPCNSNVDHWQELPIDKCVSEINAFFSEYEGKFTCYELK